MADEQSHEVQIEEIRSVDPSNPETKYRAICTRCGAVSSWFQNRGLAKSNLNKYPCEVEDMSILELLKETGLATESETSCQVGKLRYAVVSTIQGSKQITSLHCDGFSAWMDACNSSSDVYEVKSIRFMLDEVMIELGDCVNEEICK